MFGNDCCMYMCCGLFLYCFFFKQKTAYEMRISDWSSDVCSSDLQFPALPGPEQSRHQHSPIRFLDRHFHTATVHHSSAIKSRHYRPEWLSRRKQGSPSARKKLRTKEICSRLFPPLMSRSEEHTSELQSLMRISYAVFCLKKKK